MSRVKDPQVTLVGLVKSVGSPSEKREMVVVSVPPQITPGTAKLVERTLLVNLPDADHVGNTVRCYLKSRLFDDRLQDETGTETRNRNNDPQTILIGLIKRVNGDHKLVVVDFPVERLFPTEDYLATTLIVNVPGAKDNDEDEYAAVDCYLKYKVVDANDRRVMQHLNNQQRYSTV